MAALIKYGLLNPVITGPLLYILTKGPEQYQQPILQALGPYLAAKVLPGAITALKWLFALGIIRPVHEFLNELANNNFRWKAEVYDWPNEIAVVTGGANGFGRLMSEGLAAHGVTVMALDISDSLPKEMQSNKKIHYYKCDVTSADAVNATADAIRAEHGNPSVLINNAGIAIAGTILEQTPDTIRRVFDVNTISHYYTVNAFLPAMISKHKGHIVTIASMASFLSGPVRLIDIHRVWTYTNMIAVSIPIPFTFIRVECITL
jgi:all-trans-retinol dehydrogenase (NAD+)